MIQTFVLDMLSKMWCVFLWTVQPKREQYLSKVVLELHEHLPCLVSHEKMHFGSITNQCFQLLCGKYFPLLIIFFPLSVHENQNSFFMSLTRPSLLKLCLLIRQVPHLPPVLRHFFGSMVGICLATRFQMFLRRVRFLCCVCNNGCPHTNVRIA